MTTDNLQKIHVTTINYLPEMYVGGLVFLKNINSVYYEGGVYIARNNEIVVDGRRQSILSMVQKGLDVYYLS